VSVSQSVHRSVNQLVSGSLVWSVDQSVGPYFGRSISQLVCSSASRSVVWSVFQPVDQSVGPLVGRLNSESISRLLGDSGQSASQQ
jgi:hypothetical protein